MFLGTRHVLIKISIALLLLTVPEVVKTIRKAKKTIAVNEKFS